MDERPQNLFQRNGKILFGFQNTGLTKSWSLQVALEEFSNESSSETGTSNRANSTVPGAGLTRFNKNVLEAWARKKRPSRVEQDDMLASGPQSGLHHQASPPGVTTGSTRIEASDSSQA